MISSNLDPAEFESQQRGSILGMLARLSRDFLANPVFLACLTLSYQKKKKNKKELFERELYNLWILYVFIGLYIHVM